MTDAGFFRGTSADQDNRFANKQKKLLKELNFSPILNTKLNMTKINVESLKPWIEQKIKDVLEKDDELLSESIYEHLAEKEPDGKNILVLITGFVDDSKASKFMEELWTKLIDLQENSNGVNKFDNNAKQENPDPDSEPPKPKEKDDGDDTIKQDDLNEGTNNKESQKRPGSSSSSHSATPPSRSVSKSPGGNHKLDERSRGRPRRRIQDEQSRDGSNSPGVLGEAKKTRSRSRSMGRSRSPSTTGRAVIKSAADGDEPRRARSRSTHSKQSGSRSISRSRSGSRSRSRSYSGSKSRSRTRSRSSTRSPRHRSRSPHGHSYRGRRSRSRDRGYHPRSRSPRGLRGFGRGSRGGPYRGSFNTFHDRRRGSMGGPIRRRSPWGRRRFSPRSPPRRRRTPSFSPRRRRSPSPYHRRPSRSRSPPGHHMMNRNISSPRTHNMPAPHTDMMGSRHMPHHDMHRSMVPINRSPRVPFDHHRGYVEGPMLSRHSPGPIMSKPDLPATSHGQLLSQGGPSGSGLYSPPSSGKKKHKKEKKHRKHKKSKKHRSASPEKKKKHKKHKKTKKHKSS